MVKQIKKTMNKQGVLWSCLSWYVWQILLFVQIVVCHILLKKMNYVLIADLH